MFRTSHLLDLHAGRHYSSLAKTMYAQQIYGATAIKSGRVIAWKAIMTVETAGLRGAGTDAKQFAWPYTGSSLLLP